MILGNYAGCICIAAARRVPQNKYYNIKFLKKVNIRVPCPGVSYRIQSNFSVPMHEGDVGRHIFTALSPDWARFSPFLDSRLYRGIYDFIRFFMRSNVCAMGSLALTKHWTDVR